MANGAASGGKNGYAGDTVEKKRERLTAATRVSKTLSQRPPAQSGTLRSNDAPVLETHRLLRQAIPGQVGELEVKHLGQTRRQMHTDLQESVPQSHRDSEVAREIRNRT